ncbi:MBL fold metallo-hydrolase [Lysinibacillus fusiformis]|nr:MBL fold metallo-hydrolase [Lysinibacillus fusiformis]
MLNVEILGGVGEYGRNCFYLEKEGRAILLDCGVMNNHDKTFPDLTQAHVAKLEAVFISHSHIDHVGALPLLEKWGYSGQLFMSKMTAQQLKPTYENIIVFQPESVDNWINISESLSFQWGYSGHLIGSVWYKIRFLEEVMFFSGDYVMDSYLLKATIPTEDDRGYDLAFIDSGHVEKRIKNIEVLQKIMEFISAKPSCPIIFPSSFSGKTADIAVYLFQHTAREVRVDNEFLSFFEDYNVAPENMLSSSYNTILKSFKNDCLQDKAVGDNAIYFIPERDESTISKLLLELPTAIVIFTGYCKKGSYVQQLAQDRAMQFFYKTHPDYNDIIALSQKINAQKIIYFHSQLTTKETTLLTIIGNEDDVYDESC